MTSGEEKPRVTVEAIVGAVAAAFEVPVSTILGRERFPETALPRLAAMWLAVQLTRELYGDIGKAIGGRDRKTVRTAARRIDERLERDARLAETLDLLKLSLTRQLNLSREMPAVRAIETALADLGAGKVEAVRVHLAAALQELTAGSPALWRRAS